MKPKSWSWRAWFWYRVIVFATRRAGRSSGACANRYMYTCWFGPLEMSITIRDTKEPDGYSREELVEMLAIIRAQETQQEWKVPEPSHFGC